MPKRFLLSGISIAVALLVTYLVYIGITWQLSQPAEDVADRFLSTLGSGDYLSAYSLLDSSMQAQTGSPQGLRDWITAGGFSPQSWSFFSRQISNLKDIELEGRIESGGQHWDCYFLLRRDSTGAWKVSTFRTR